MDTKDLGKGLLRETALLAVGAEVPAEIALKVSFHAGKAALVLLDGLQTHE